MEKPDLALTEYKSYLPLAPDTAVAKSVEGIIERLESAWQKQASKQHHHAKRKKRKRHKMATHKRKKRLSQEPSQEEVIGVT